MTSLPVRFPIAAKIMAGFLLLVMLLGGALVYVASYSLRSGISQQLEKRAVTLAQSVAAQTPDFIYTGDYYTLYQLLVASLENNEDVRYLFVLDGSGNVLASTFGDGLPLGLAAANHLPPDEPSHVVLLATSEGVLHDVAVPLPGGAQEGVVRVGVAEVAAGQAVVASVKRLLLVIVVVLVGGALAAYGLIRALTRPLKRLLEVTRAFAAGDFATRARLSSRDEIGELGKAFDQMADSLERLVGELQRKEEARLLLLRKVISAQEEERKRVARELHDEIGQCFTSIAVGLRALEHLDDPRELRRRTAQLRALATRAIEDVQYLSRMLRPSVLDDLGLVPAIERCVQDVAAKFGLRAELSVQGLEGRLPLEVETALYRIIQEGLTNVGRHARAKRVRVAVERQDGLIVASVEDDGRGFQVNRVWGKDALGLFGMQERATLVGGEFQVVSAPGQGTRIVVRVPVGCAQGGMGREQDQAAAG